MSDERVREVGFIRRLMASPELGAISGAVLVFLFFGLTANGTGMFAADGVINWMTVSAQLGILAIGACLLMIAGEFDLSVGSMIGFAGMLIAIPTAFWGWPVWAAILFAFAGAAALGFLNGYLVIRTGLPSFIVSLAFLFILRGLTIAMAVGLTNRTIINIDRAAIEADPLAGLFGGTFGHGFCQWLADIGLINAYADGGAVVEGIPMVILWWFVLAGIASWVLLRTRFGNWIFASGGDAKAACNVGVPTARVKITLFIVSALCATLFATTQVTEFASAAADRGMLKEFEAIIAVVIGGALLTGGYGSVVGACFGALIFGVVQQGIFFTGANSEWFRVFLGLTLLVAVLFNNFVRTRVTSAK